MRTTLLHGALVGRAQRSLTRMRARRMPLVVAVSFALVLPAGLVQVAQAHPAPGGLGRPDAPTYRAGKLSSEPGRGGGVARAHLKAARDAQVSAGKRAATEQEVHWPAAGSATGVLSGGSAARLTAGGMPISVSRGDGKSAAGQVRVTSLGQTAADAAGIKGVLFQATAATPGAARLDVGYGRFASAFGGGWGSRLRLVQLPGCVLTRPRDAGCRTPAPLVSHNDLATQTLTADVSLTAAPGTTTARTAAAPMVFAAEASGSGGESPSGSGNYSATPMSASSTWAAGGSSGSFTWSYPLAVPAAAAGPAPSIGLSYDSGSVDGKTATTNNQATQLGEGFTLTSDAYITRTYGNCDDDGQDSKNDECWKYDNASLVLEGHSSELVKDDSAPDTWRLKDDDASTVTHSTGAANGDEGDSGSGMDGAGEYWTVTTGDGTKYVFGLNKLPGAGTERTNSVWTVPIFGDDAGEPGYGDGSSFSSRSLNQAWRWNLDYVVDVHGNAATYWYTPETNYYGKNGATTGTAAYVRAGHLDKILYGQRSDTLFTAKASDQVVFTYAERCFADDCSSLTKDTADHWPDVPFDAVCAKDADCRATAPAFFTRKRLTSIETSAWLAASNTYDGVDKWDFAEEFLDPGDIGDTSDQSLVLDSIVHTGEGGSDSIALKPVTFTYRPLANRVDATDDILPLSRYRIDTITSETGAITTVTLAPADCVRGSVMPAAEDNDDKACFPQYWHVNGSEDASLDWFQKYPVKAVVTTDSTKGFGEGVEHSYSYAQPGWAYNDDPFTPQDERTWSDFRGFGTVTETTGAGGTTQSRTVSLYMLGLDGDKRKDTSATRSATVTGIEFPSLTIPDLVDSRPYAGAKREQITYNGSSPVSVTVSEPWSKKTATQHKSYADIEAYYVRTAKTSTNTYLTVSQTWRTRTVSTTYDSYGMVATTDDSGDTAKSGDEACTRNWYARNAATAITSLVSRTRTVARPCSVADADLNLPATKATRGDVLSDTATVFDDTAATTWSPDQSPTKGEATWSGRPSGYPALASGGERNPSGWQTLVRTVYDDSTAAGLGRPVTMKDVQGHTSTTSYVPVAAGPTTQTTVTGPPTAASPNGQTIVTDFDPERGKTVKTTGVDGKVSEATYDALGRITATWLTNRRRILHQAANYVYAYHPDNTAPSWQSTGTLKADGTTYNTVYTFYDFLLRPLQTQSPTPNGGRLVTDTRYDTRGLAYETYADIFDPANTPSGIYARAEYGGAPKQTETVYDGAGRATTSTLLIFGVQQWSTTTSYTGDSTAVTGLDGGSAVRTITDALGRNTEERRYAGTSPADVQYGSGVGTAYTATKFTYTLDGGPSTVTSPDGAQWSYTYDLYGRQTKAVDPDAGTTTTGYTDLDQVSWTKDAEGRVVISAYDELGRLTGTWTAPAGADLTSTSEEQIPANQLTGRTYDTPVVGQPSSSTRYVGGSASGKAYTSKVTAYDSLNRATATELDLPAGDPLVTSGAVTSALAVSTAYNTDGTQQFVKTPAAGGLPSETVETRYNGFGLPTTLQGTSGYVNGTSYSPLGQVSQLDLATSAAAGIKHMFVTNTFQDGTDRLKLSKVTDQTHPYEIQELNYDYDDAGNVTHIFDPTTLGGTGKADNQCFGYDGYDRMTEAWTPAAADCSTANRTATSLGGASPYWTSYTYTDGGLRSTQTTHTAAGSTLATYCYNNASHPHGLTAVIPSAACAGAPTQYTYDATGNTQTRPKGTSTETLGWNAENRLASVKVPSGTTTDTTNYLYDADGTLLIRSDDSGETVLYLDGVTEVHLKKSGTTTYWAQRTYTLFGATVAVRTNQPGQPTLSWTAGDPHGTGSLAVTATGTDQVVTKRYTTPFGAPRTGGTGTWPDDKGFLGKPQDNTTGLTYIGARAYDTTTGRFISVDPLLDTSDGQSLNGYAYADNNPTTNSDPTGLLCVRGDCNAPGAGLNGGNGPAPGDDLYDENVDYCNKHDCDRDGDPNASNGPTKDIVGDPLPPLPANNRATFLRMYNLQLQVSIKYHMRPHMESQKWAAAMQGCIETDACTAGESRAYMWAFLVALAHEDPSIVMASARSMGGGFAEFSGFSVLGSEKDLSLFKGRFCSHSFVADTEVELADGQTKDIEDVEVGDKVVTTDPDTGKTAVRPVIATIITDHDKNFTDLTVKAGSTSASIVATDTHPFWVVNEGRWVDAGDLTPGMQLRDDAGQAVPVLAARHFVQQQRTYDLTIDDLHTYYVLAGQTPVLVHNDGGAGFDLNKLDRPGYSNYVLVDRNNVPYYSGMFGPNESPASVQRRHSGTWNRYDPANGDRMDVFPGTRTYGQSRLLEQRMTDHFGTYIGEDGTNYRGNRQNPMDSKKEPGYLAYERYKNGGCP